LKITYKKKRFIHGEKTKQHDFFSNRPQMSRTGLGNQSPLRCTHWSSEEKKEDRLVITQELGRMFFVRNKSPKSREEMTERAQPPALVSNSAMTSSF
jgi:hypothetical protein